VPPESGNGYPSAPSGKTGGQREIIFEFTPIGGSVKVAAVDVLTGVEVSVTGPVGPASQRELQRIALAKLRLRLVREGYAADTPDVQPKGSSDSGGGIIV
tara:strand:+ start:15172 stop:15471 length:300 start_codon:yes stop_codon:yes gene_type:complete